MTIYAPTDVTSITAPGGCGNAHAKPTDDPDNSPFTLTCPACEPVIIGLKLGWGYELHQVAPTCDEIAIAEAAEKSAQRQQNLTWGNPSALAGQFAAALAAQGMQQPPAAPAPTLLEQLAALDPADRAAIRAMLGETPAARPAEAPGVEVPPVEAVPESMPVVVKADTPPTSAVAPVKPVAKKTAAKKATASAPQTPAE